MGCHCTFSKVCIVAKFIKMLNPMKSVNSSLLFISLLTCCFFSLVGQTLASSLGPLSGSVLIGKPLDVNLIATHDENSANRKNCFQANVVFGERSISFDRIVIGSQAGTSPNETRVRIQSLIAIDEPVVTVTISEGCQQKSTKSYVLFAELQNSLRPIPSDSSDLPNRNSARSTNIQNVPTLLKQTPATGIDSGVAVLKKSPNKPLSSTTNTPSDQKAQTTATSQIAKNSIRKPSSKTNTKPLPSTSRLQLQPLDFFSDAPLSQLTLRASSELDLAPNPNRLDRNAAVLLWQSLNTQPQDIESAKQKLQNLQSENLRLESEKSQTQNAAIDLTNQLENARNERYSNTLVWLLLFLLLLLIVILVAMFNHYKKLKNTYEGDDEENIAWWKQTKNIPDATNLKNSFNDVDEMSFEPLNDEHELNLNGNKKVKNNQLFSKIRNAESTSISAVVSLDSVAFNKPTKKTNFVQSDIDLNNLFGNDSGNSHASYKKGLSMGLLATIPVENRINLPFDFNEFSQSLSVDEIFDVHQKADLFVSLGDFDNAIAVLKNHISENSDKVSSVAYLDLFDLYHILGKRDNYNALRGEFNRIYNTHVPEFDEYKTISVGLEMYPIAMSRIESLWPRQEVLSVIERSIFEKPESPRSSFTLEAYRDLLLLYAIAKKIIDETQDYLKSSIQHSKTSDSSLRKNNFHKTAATPLSTEQSKISMTAVDIDLSQIASDKPDKNNKNNNFASSNLIDFDN